MWAISISILLIPSETLSYVRPPDPVVKTPKEQISFYASKYGASEKELLAVAKCESQFNPKAVGDKGKAKNIYQYHKPTFDSFSKLMGEKLDYNSYHDQAKLTAYIFSKHPKLKSHWTCWSKLLA